jgi:HAD superfamily hydrolase (TIGR01509 family)
MLSSRYGISIDPREAMAKRLAYFLASTLEHGLRPNPGIREIVSGMRGQGKPTVMISSQRPEVIAELLGRWTMTGDFTRILTVYDPDLPDTKLDLLRAAPDALRLAPRELILFEDSTAALELAATLGMRTVAVVHALNAHVPVSADVVLPTSTGPPDREPR